MRCKACNRILEDSELTKKGLNDDFLDLCNTCLYASSPNGVEEISTIYENIDLTLDEDYDTLY